MRQQKIKNQASKIKNQESLKWLATFLVLATLIRWGTLFISVINHDESTYIVIADEMLRGEVYFRDVVDTKPIGIFWIYELLIWLTGGSIVALRVAAAWVIGLGGFGLYQVGRRATGSERTGVAAGLIYLLVCSVYTYYGISPNTEIFFNAFTIGAVAVAVAPRIRQSDMAFWTWTLAGFLLGLAFIIKPFAAAEALAVGLFALWFYGRDQRWGQAVAAGLVLIGGFIIPPAFVYAYYAKLDLLEAFHFYTFDVSAAYPIELPWYLRLKYMGDYLLRYLPFVILGAGAQVQIWRSKSKAVKNWSGYLILQFLIVTVVVLLTGKRFGHYQIQLHPVLALLAALWWLPKMKVFPALRREQLRKYIPVIITVLFAAIGTAMWFKYTNKRDEPRQIADYLADRLPPDETFFAINGFQIAYHLLDRPVPTPYVHSSLLFLDHHVRAFRVNETVEAERLIKDPTVTYVIERREDEDADTPLRTRLLEHFTLTDSIGERLLVYQRLQ